MKLTYPAVVYAGQGGFAVEVPDLPGCVSGGADLAEAIMMGTDAAVGWVLDELEDGKPAPAPSPIHDITPPPGGFVTMLVLNMDTTHASTKPASPRRLSFNRTANRSANKSADYAN
jgi:predicted RNase H-like HicB family nuclease